MRIRTKMTCVFAACAFAVALCTCLANVDATVVGFYDFDEGSGTAAADSSGNGFNGVLSGSTLPTWVSNGGASGDTGDHSLDYVEAVSGYVDLVGNPASLQLTGNRTISLWIKSDAVVASRRSFLEKAYAHEGTYHIYQNGSFYLYHGDEVDPNVAGSGAHSVTITGTGVATTGTWLHLVHTRDSANETMQYYINGVGQGNVNWTPALRNPNTVSNFNWRIGTGYAGTFGGELDDVAFMDRELTPAEIASMYQLNAQSDNALRAMDLNVPELDELWDIYDGGLNNSGTVGGKTWTHVDGISAGGHVLGESWTTGNALDGFDTYLLLDDVGNSGLLFQVAGIPEPSSLLLLGLGVLGLMRQTRRRRRA